MRVLILAEVEAGGIGGGESVVVGLVRGLAAVANAADCYVILCSVSLAVQLAPYAGRSVEIVTRPRNVAGTGAVLRSMFGPLRRPLGTMWRWMRGRKAQGLPATVPKIDTFIRSLDCDVTHFVIPIHFASGAPKPVFAMNDLQHEHLPKLFSDEHVRYRRMLYSAVRAECDAVVAISNFTAQDFLRHHPIPMHKMFRVPLAPYVHGAKDDVLTRGEQRMLQGLPPEYILYPAYSYEHKNHVLLLEALSLAAARGVVIPIVCTGGRSAYWTKVLAQAQLLDPQPRLIDLGYVGSAALKALYRSSKLVVFPSLFEGAGLPLMEAGAMGKALACSRIAPFVEFGGTAPAYFDPASAESIVRAVSTLWTDDAARHACENAMRSQTDWLSWADTARAHVAIYRQVAGESLSSGELAWLQRSRVSDPA